MSRTARKDRHRHTIKRNPSALSKLRGELECDDDKERFEGRLKKIAKTKPKEMAKR
jgi:hypothetical protein